MVGLGAGEPADQEPLPPRMSLTIRATRKQLVVGASQQQQKLNKSKRTSMSHGNSCCYSEGTHGPVVGAAPPHPSPAALLLAQLSCSWAQASPGLLRVLSEFAGPGSPPRGLGVSGGRTFGATIS